MSIRRIVNLLAAAISAVTVVASAESQLALRNFRHGRAPGTATPSGCRAIPGDSAWPTAEQWNSLNQTVGGRLIATVPIAAPCHSTLNGEPNPYFDTDECESLRNVWYFPETHLPSPNSPMAYQYSNNSCNPFLDPSTPCTNGYLVSYTVNATGPGHVQAAIGFALIHNIRLVIRNTGHDYLGKSTGAFALGVWVHYMKSQELIPYYASPGYAGPAFKFGAGVEGIEAYEFAHNYGLVVVGPNCPTVGMAGGYVQGGGHGPLVTKFGLAADQVLAFEVVTGLGMFVTATAENNSDLFWALRGGGGSTYGVVTSITVKGHPDESASLAYLTVMNNGTNADAIYNAMGTFFNSSLLNVVDAGAWLTWIAAPYGFFISPAFGLGLPRAEMDSLLQPTLTALDTLGLEYEYSSAEYPNFLSGYYYNSNVSSWNVSDYNLGGRLVPREVIHNNTDGLVEAIRYISSRAPMTGVCFNVSNGVPSPDSVGVNPDIRSAIFSGAVGTPVNYTDWPVTIADENEITDSLLPQLRALSPGSGVYLNEADVQDPDFETDFYGSHYDKLLQIKGKYDPAQIFYAPTAVGSDRWAQGVDGRLCTV